MSLLVVIAVVALVASTTMIRHRTQERAADARISVGHVQNLLGALDRYWAAHCADVPFPAPTQANLVAEGFLPAYPVNRVGGAFTVSIDLAGPRPRATVSANMPDGDMNSWLGMLNATRFTNRMLYWDRYLYLSTTSRNRLFTSMYHTPRC